MLVILIRPFGRVRLKGGLPLYLSLVREGIICRFPSPNPRVRSTQVREASPSGVNDASALNCTALRRFYGDGVSRCRAESTDSAADPREVGAIG